MSKASVLLTLLALASMGLSAGLWFSQPLNLSGRVAELETQLRDARATIAQLKRQPAVATSSPASPSPAQVLAPSPGGFASSGSLRAASSAAPQLAPSSVTGLTPVSASAPPSSSAEATSAAPQDSRTMKKMAEAEARYASLINQFNLAPAEKEYFKQLAATRSEVLRHASTKLQDPTLTPAERQAIFASTKQEMTSSDAAVRQFLNSDADFGKFIAWEQTDIERAQVETGRGIFENNQTPLSPDQEEWLVNSLHNMRKDTVHGLADPYELRSLAGTTVDRTYVQNVLKKFDVDTQVLLQDARGRFNQPQLESLTTFRKQQRVNMEARLWNMARTTNR